MIRLTAEHLGIGYGKATIVEDLNIQIPDGKVTALVGPNGSGKSTILKALARLLSPVTGTILLDGKSISKMHTRDIAKQLAILPQNPISPEGLTVSELIAYGRFPHQGGFGITTEQDRKMIQWALQMTGMQEFSARPVDQMSGGQRQRAWIAMALAQGTDILFLDEPTTFLDMAHQLEVLQLLKRLNQKEKRTIVMVVHDLNHASQYADYILALKKGKIMREGTPVEVINEDMLREVFGVEANFVTCEQTGVPLCLPIGLVAQT